MKICHLSINNFRGISELNWFIESDINCLIGPGDTTKSTILAAIYYAFAPTWNPTFRDSDFYNQDYKNSIVIIATIKDVPLGFKERFGAYARGLTEGAIIDEPENDAVPVWSIKLSVNENLEPTWSIYTEREFEVFPSVSLADRRSLEVYKLGNLFDTDFSWMKGSSLARMSDQETTLREALRSIRTTSAFDPESKLQEVAGNVQMASKSVCVIPDVGFKPGIDTKSLEENRGVLSLYDGEVPLRMKGLGTKRLIATSIQKTNTGDHSILTIDEIESGLEPYRLRLSMPKFSIPATGLV